MHRKRTLLYKLASAIGIPLGTLHWIKQDKDDNVIAPHSSAVRPHLQDHHQFARVLYSVSNLDIDSGQYHDYFDSVHVDET
jgi:hypothetical protein